MKDKDKIKLLIKALEPFARRAKFVINEENSIDYWHPAIGSPVTVGDLKFVLKVLNEIGNDNG